MSPIGDYGDYRGWGFDEWDSDRGDDLDEPWARPEETSVRLHHKTSFSCAVGGAAVAVHMLRADTPMDGVHRRHDPVAAVHDVAVGGSGAGVGGSRGQRSPRDSPRILEVVPRHSTLEEVEVHSGVDEQRPLQQLQPLPALSAASPHAVD
mmetsp:Transcript_5880/g.8344  ORF Transcript_5880/g.8344 Transcript_5880/m.8344 type:complete len:150 (-) Transcript_5880:714-1163(-)